MYTVRVLCAVYIRVFLEFGAKHIRQRDPTRYDIFEYDRCVYIYKYIGKLTLSTSTLSCSVTLEASLIPT